MRPAPGGPRVACFRSGPPRSSKTAAPSPCTWPRADGVSSRSPATWTPTGLSPRRSHPGEPTLDDVFLQLSGHKAEIAGPDGQDAHRGRQEEGAA